jgi:tetratricopeptide (TPR) repeat protein
MDVYKDLPLTVFEEIGDLVALTGLLTAIATAEQRRGNLRAAAQLHERSREVSQMTGDARTEALIANNLGEVLLDQGRLTEAENLFGNAFEAATAAGYRLVSAAAQDNLGVVAMRRGKLDEAKRLISDAVEAYRALGARDLVLLGRAHLAECLILQDDISAPGELGAVLRDAEVIEGADQVWISGQRLRALAHARKLEINEAIRALNESLQRARQIGSPFEAARTSAVWLSLRHLLGIDPPQTEDELDAAFDMHGVVDKAAILPQPPWLRT